MVCKLLKPDRTGLADLFSGCGLAIAIEFGLHG